MNIAKYISVIAASMIKFMGGPLAGLALELKLLEIIICAIIGMMLTVFLMLFLGDFIRNIRSRFIKDKPKKKFSKITRFAIKIRQRFGLMGIAFLTPLVLSPAGGTILAQTFGYSKTSIIAAMFLWAIFWAIVQTYFFYFIEKIVI